MVLSRDLAKMLLFQLVGNQPYGTHAAKQWNLLDLWMINPFSRNLDAPTPQLTTQHAAFVPTGFPQVPSAGALWCFAMHDQGWPATACVKSSPASHVPCNGICWTSGTWVLVTTLFSTCFFWLSWGSLKHWFPMAILARGLFFVLILWDIVAAAKNIPL